MADEPTGTPSAAPAPSTSAPAQTSAVPASSGPSQTSSTAPSSTGGDGSEQVGAKPAAARPPSALVALEKAALNAQTADDAQVGAPPEAATPPPAPGMAPRGEAPLSRIEAAVRNARAKEREQIEAEIGWARQYSDPNDVHDAVDRWKRLNADPVGFLTALAGEVGYEVVPKGSNGHQPQPPAQAPAAEAELVDPEPDLRAQDGTRAYSAEAYRRLMANALERQRREMLKLVSPALQDMQQRQRTAAEQAQHAQAQQYARESFEIVSQLPHFNLDGVRAAFDAIRPEVRTRLGGHGALMTAYHNYLAKHVLPTLSAKQEAQTIEDLRRSAAAGSTAAPASAQAIAPKPRIKDGDVDGLAAHLAKLYGSAQAI